MVIQMLFSHPAIELYGSLDTVFQMMGLVTAST